MFSVFCNPQHSNTFGFYPCHAGRNVRLLIAMDAIDERMLKEELQRLSLLDVLKPKISYLQRSLNNHSSRCSVQLRFLSCILISDHESHVVVVVVVVVVAVAVAVAIVDGSLMLLVAVDSNKRRCRFGT